MERPLIVLKLREGRRVDYVDDVGSGLEGWARFSSKYPHARLDRLFRSLSPRELDALRERAIAHSHSRAVPDLKRYFRLEYPEGADPGKIAAEARSELAGDAERIYVDYPAPDPAPAQSDDPRTQHQGYLEAAPEGINARFAWRYPGGCGEGQRLVDIERGWDFEHPELKPHGITLLGGTNVESSKPHGSWVLRIVCAVANGHGFIGIAPKPGRRPVLSCAPPGGCGLEDAISVAASQMAPGDVLLIEAQRYLDATQSVCGPAELAAADREAILLATCCGIIVVEAAGNGDLESKFLDLDTYREPGPDGGELVLFPDQGNRGFVDSGAILVAAASHGAPRGPVPYTTRGRRIDCHAWGEAAVTVDGKQGSIAGGLQGTSAAAAIVAGAALAVQGVYAAHTKDRLDPLEMRKLLSNPGWNTESANGPADRIGVQPDLRGILLKGLGLPDLTLTEAPQPIPPPCPRPPIPWPGLRPLAEAELPLGKLLLALLLGFLLGAGLGVFLGIFIRGG